MSIENSSLPQRLLWILTRNKAIGVVLLLALIGAANIFSQRPTDTTRLLAAYDAAINDAAVYKSSNVRHLRPLTFDPVTKETTVVALTSYDYRLGPNTLGDKIYVWVTPVPEVQETCRFFSGNLELSLRQLLGLPPDYQLANFVVMTVAEGQIFRPAADPNVSTPLPCASPTPSNCGQEFPKNVPAPYVRWFADWALRSWVISETNQPPGYPWTRLGYTYNWKPGADKYGASEYVIQPGSSVTVLDIIPYKQYCSPKP